MLKPSLKYEGKLKTRRSARPQMFYFISTLSQEATIGDAAPKRECQVSKRKTQDSRKRGPVWKRHEESLEQ